MRVVVVPPALTLASTVELADAVASPDPLVLRGGDDVFCRGLAPGPCALEDLERHARLLLALRGRGAPTVAVVAGDALGGGLGLAAACDFVLARPGARFALPEVLFGLSPAIVLPFLRERALPAPLRRLALTGRAIDADEAARIGLVDEVAPDPEPAPLLRALARGEPGGRARLKRVPAELEAEVLAACRVTAEAIASPAARARRERFDAGLAPWEVA